MTRESKVWKELCLLYHLLTSADISNGRQSVNVPFRGVRCVNLGYQLPVT